MMIVTVVEYKIKPFICRVKRYEILVQTHVSESVSARIGPFNTKEEALNCIRIMKENRMAI